MTSTQNLRKFAFNVHPDGRVDAMTMVPGNIHESIPTGIYRIRFDPEAKNLYLDQSEFPNPPPKIYGSVHKDTARYLKTFETQDTCMGIGLYGLKGTGKTTTLQVIAKTAMGLDYPVVIIDHAIPLEMLANLFAKIKQNIVVMFDEFDKHYYNPEANERSSSQNGILNILDGSCGGGKKLTVICANDYGRINEYLKGRPGRIRYSKFFESLKFPEVMEYFKDNYKQRITTKEMIQLSILVRNIQLTYDLLKAYITESNIHNESIVDSIQVISNEIFHDLKSSGTFGGQYSCIHCFDEKGETHILRINEDYSSYSVLKRTPKTNEFDYRYIDTIEFLKGDIEELNIAIGESGFEIEINSLKLKTKNYLFDTDWRSDEKIIEDSGYSKKHNPSVKLDHSEPNSTVIFNVVKNQQSGLSDRGMLRGGMCGANNNTPKTSEPLNWDWTGSSMNNPDDPIASSNG